jgi:hypothetical protein
MRPRFYQLLSLVVLSSLTLGTPLRAEAQGARIVIGATVGVGGPRGPVAQIQWQQPYGRQYGNNGQWSGSNGPANLAMSNGYRDGYDKGLADARDRRAYDPRRHRLFRDGDHGYRRDVYMPRNRYQDSFRRGFLSGYDTGYRDAQRRWNSRDDRYRRDRNDQPYPPRRW